MHLIDLYNSILHSLAQLPLFDLLKTVCLVSRQWRDLVYRPEFMPWKKSYYKYKVDQVYVKLLDMIDPTVAPNLESESGKEWLGMMHHSFVSIDTQTFSKSTIALLI